MTDQRSGIEARLADLLGLIRARGRSTAELSQALGISKQTLSHAVRALRERGYEIRTVRGPSGWIYELEGDPPDGNGRGR